MMHHQAMSSQKSWSGQTSLFSLGHQNHSHCQNLVSYPDVSSEEHSSVWQLVEEFADIFALSVHKVKHILGAEHCLDIPKDAPLHTKIGWKPMTLPQVAYFSKALNIMVDVGICTPIAAKDIKCISPITLAEKGMTMDELHQKINMECDNIGVPSPFIPPPNAQPLVVPDHKGVIQP